MSESTFPLSSPQRSRLSISPLELLVSQRLRENSRVYTPSVLARLGVVSSITSKHPRTLLSMPVEVLELIVEAGRSGTSGQDLTALASTCSLLSEIVRRIIPRDVRLTIGPNTERSKLLSLVAFATSQHGSQTRTVSLALECILPPVYLSYLVPCLHGWHSLKHLQIATFLLSDVLLEVIYKHPTLTFIEINDFQGSVSQDLDVEDDSRLPRFPRPSGEPLVLQDFVGTLYGGEGFSQSLVESRLFIDFLFSYGFRISSLGIRLVDFEPDELDDLFQIQHSGPLVVQHQSSLRRFNLLVTPGSASTGYTLLESIVEAQVDLLSLVVVVEKPSSVFPFAASNFLPQWTDDGFQTSLSAQTLEEWSSTRIRKLQGTYRRGSEGRFELDTLEIVFKTGTVIYHGQIHALESEEFLVEVNRMTMVSALFGGDWDQTASCFSYILNIPTTIQFLNSSLTPLPTFGRTLACSSSCYSRLATSHPYLHLDSELLGGYKNIARLLFAINYRRFEHLTRLLPPGSQVKLTSAAEDGTERLAFHGSSYPRPNGDGGAVKYIVVSPSNWCEEAMGRSSCFGCERRKGVLTVEPIRALRACGVEEVHQTLFREGFDLAGFFKSPPSEPVDPSSLETFLRSSSETKKALHVETEPGNGSAIFPSNSDQKPTIASMKLEDYDGVELKHCGNSRPRFSGSSGM
ncbi:hypothetical protein BDY24DRAFT_444113 [Mrakia frigida]|uniref:uncharacterized protein n=1 Tax=Mrakia frigida TaxID=29902 RepID=UPI003FCC0BFD